MSIINGMQIEKNMYQNKNFLKKTYTYYFIGILSLILANLFFSLSFFFTEVILLSLIIQYTFIFFFKYYLYIYFKIFDELNFKKYLIFFTLFFIFNNFYLNFITFKNIYLAQFAYSLLTSLIGFLIMNKIMNK